MSDTVKDVYEKLGKLIAEGHGGRPLFAISGSSGVSYGVSMCASTRINNGNIDGPLQDEDSSLVFVPVYLD